MMIPTQTVLTNELKLQDFKGTKISITYGDADINDGYSYARMNFRANDDKLDFWIDKPRMNFITEELTLNDKKVWNEFNDGPNSGLNADMLDGMHGAEFKDRYGHNHFLHMFYTSGGKRFVKVATFTPRKVGAAPDFNVNGTPPYQGIFPFSGNGVNGVSNQQRILQSMAIKDEIEQFKINTPQNLATDGTGIFRTTDMLTEGIYNGVLRASVSLLKLGEPTTFDIHLGIFEDPMNTIKDGWQGTYKYFYVSAHDELLPFISEDYKLNTSTDPNAAPAPLSEELLTAIEKQKSIIDILSGEKTIAEAMADMENNSRHIANAPVSIPNPYEVHGRPIESTLRYVTPHDPTKDYIPPAPFPPYAHEGNSYAQFLDIMRLYHVDTHIDTVDGVEVITHKFDLYLCIDEKTEVHIQPYMSSACLLYNFQKPVTSSELPKTTNFLRPKSIYDERYAHKKHRHYDYEEKMWHLIQEVDQIWDAFDYYVVIAQGEGNARKILMTDEKGDIFCADDNMERHKDARRAGGRVLVSNIDKCIAESEILIEELAQLKGIESNVQGQIHDLLAMIQALEKTVNAILKDIEKVWADLALVWEEIRKLKLRVSAAEDRLTALEDRLTSTETGLSGSDDRITKLETRVTKTESRITVTEGRLDDIDKKFDSYVRKTGDVMIGDLIMKHGSRDGRFYIKGNGRSIAMFGGSNSTDYGVWDEIRNFEVLKYRYEDGGAVRFGAKSIMLDGKKLTLSSTAPASPITGDIWIKNS